MSPARIPGGNIIYWMSREQRTAYNPGLLLARELASEYNSTLTVAFTLTDNYPGAALRHYDFMLRGLKEVSEKLKLKNIPFELLIGSPAEELIELIHKKQAGTVVSDFDPLRIKNEWKTKAVEGCKACFIEVDGHNIVPARYVSDKVEFGAYTLRPKIRKNLVRFLEEIPGVEPMRKENFGEQKKIEVEAILDQLSLNQDVKPVTWILPGEDAAICRINSFLEGGLAAYASNRNNPAVEGTSGLSPYLHFGQISAMHVAVETLRRCPSDENTESFLEELIVRKELSDNFCLYNQNYDNARGFHSWARKSLEEHRRDEREYTYRLDELENALTHDPLWNAAQLEMVRKGKMHGYLRMYWAKKILEWTPSVEDAMDMAIYLNDKYELDGRDPNGYTGIAWAIGGVHDRAWQERPVFGKIRYMNYNGARRKFNVDDYIRYVKNLK